MFVQCTIDTTLYTIPKSPAFIIYFLFSKSVANNIK